MWRGRAQTPAALKCRRTEGLLIRLRTISEGHKCPGHNYTTHSDRGIVMGTRRGKSRVRLTSRDPTPWTCLFASELLAHTVRLQGERRAGRPLGSAPRPTRRERSLHARVWEWGGRGRTSWRGSLRPPGPRSCGGSRRGRARGRARSVPRRRSCTCSWRRTRWCAAAAAAEATPSSPPGAGAATSALARRIGGLAQFIPYLSKLPQTTLFRRECFAAFLREFFGTRNF